MLEVKERLFSYVPPNNTEVYERALVGDIGLYGRDCGYDAGGV